MRRYAVVALLGLMGCGSPTAPVPTVPDVWGAVGYAPLPEYAGWAGDVARCLGIHADGASVVAEIRWVAVDAIDPERTRMDADGTLHLIVGQYAILDGAPTIYVLRGRVSYGPTVRHELVHHLLWTRRGHADGQHRSGAWGCV